MERAFVERMAEVERIGVVESGCKCARKMGVVSWES